MSTPSSLIYVRPGWASHAWSYAGATMPSGASASSSAVMAVAFDASASLGQAAARGDLQFSLDAGKTWTAYALPVDGEGAWVSVAGTVWRFADRSGADTATPDSFNAHYRLQDGSTVTLQTTVIPDTQPVGLTGQNDILFTTMQAGAVADLLAPIDSGAMTGGRWTIDGQSQPGLFSIAYDPATDTGARLVIADGSRLPASGGAAAVTVHYYDRYQLDTGGNPIAGQGVTRTLTYTVEDGVTRDLSGFSDEAKLGAAASLEGASPALARLSNGGLVAVWQGADTAPGGAGLGLWAQLRDGAGHALGGAFALTPTGDAAIEGQPAVTALADGRFAVAYTVNHGGAAQVAYRVIEAGGRAGPEHVLDAGASGDAAMPAMATLADGSFVVGWRSAGAVHVQQAGADGAPIGAEHLHAALGSAYSPSLAAQAGGGWVVAWGEINDGNVYAAMDGNGGHGGNSGAPFTVNTDGYAASITTAAPLPHVTALAGGGFVVAWDSYANDPYGFSISDIYFQRYDGAGNPAGDAVQANVASGGGRYDAAIAALSDGGFVVTWQGADGDANGIFGRRFDAGGHAVDAQEFAVSQARAGDQLGPDVVALANGGFATAWTERAPDGSIAVEARVLQGEMVSAPAAAPADGGAHLDAATPAVPVTISGGAGHDTLAVPGGQVRLDGGDGMDRALYAGVRASYTIAHEGAGFSVSDAQGNYASLANVERIQFADQMVALDIGGVGGEAYRLYQAAFDRTPDKGGLGYWIAMMDEGQDLEGVAANFVDSPEFRDLYGANSTDAQFVQALYHNVLHRAAEGAGYDFWMQSLQSVSRAAVLTNFSESAENQAQVIGSIQDGINYLDWHS